MILYHPEARAMEIPRVGNHSANIYHETRFKKIDSITPDKECEDYQYANCV